MYIPTHPTTQPLHPKLKLQQHKIFLYLLQENQPGEDITQYCNSGTIYVGVKQLFESRCNLSLVVFSMNCMKKAVNTALLL